MRPDTTALSRFLVLYQFVDKESGQDPVLHIQIYPGCGNNTAFTILHEKQLFDKIDVFHVPRNKPLQSFSVEDGDIVVIRTISNEIVSAGGIWQVRWHNVYENGFVRGKGFVLAEISSSGLEIVKVEELLQEEDFVLFTDAVAHATAFLEAHNNLFDIWFVNGREVGTFAPEQTHQMTPLLSDTRAVEHLWYLVLTGHEKDSPGQTFSLMEVVYRFENQKWQFFVRILEERDASSSISTEL